MPASGDRKLPAASGVGKNHNEYSFEIVLRQNCVADHICKQHFENSLSKLIFIQGYR